MPEPWEEALDAVSVLVDPVRRSMFRFVRSVGRPVSREEVAEATGTSVKLVAFHLDKLLEHGWLRAQYDQSSRSKSGGRPPKLYEPADRTIELNLPPRRYDLLAGILLDATATGGKAVTERARRVAQDRGRQAAARGQGAGRRRPLGPERTLAAAVDLLADLGFEPRVSGPREVVMANCPFHALAETAPGTVCALNQALAEGLIEGLGGSGVEAVLDPARDRCCVVLRRPT